MGWGVTPQVAPRMNFSSALSVGDAIDRGLAAELVHTVDGGPDHERLKPSGDVSC